MSPAKAPFPDLPGTKMTRPIRLLVVLAVMSTLGIVITQAYWVRKALNLHQRQLEESTQIALQQVAHRMGYYYRAAVREDAVEKVGSDYFVVEVSHHFDKAVLEYYLRQAFLSHKLDVGVEYAVYDCSRDRMSYGSYLCFMSQPPDSPVRTGDMPKLASASAHNYFGIRLIGVEGYLARQMDIWIFSSGVLLVVIVFFGYSLGVILRQRRLSEVQRELLHSLSHELMTPVTTLALSGEALSRPGAADDPVRVQTYGSLIQREADRLKQQLAWVLQHARADHDSLRLNRDWVAADSILEALKDTFAPMAERVGGKLTLEMDPKGRDLFLDADRVQLTNALYNLLDNALKYGGANPQIRLALLHDGSHWELRVQDSGPGIPRGHRDRIFQPFYRLPGSSMVQGYGLGLSYVRRIVKAHGWRLRLDTGSGKGCTFRIRIPARHVGDEAMAAQFRPTLQPA